MRTLSPHAQAAKSIRKELKLAFPKIKFSVTSCCYSMGDSVSISYDNGPLTHKVEAITNKYQHGNYNGMEDIYEDRKTNTNGSSKFVMVQRNIDSEIRMIGKALIQDNFEGLHGYDYDTKWYALSSNTDLTNKAIYGVDFDNDCFLTQEVK